MADEKRKPGRPPGSKTKSGNATANKKVTGKTSTGKKTAANKKEKKPIKAGSRVNDEIWAIIIMAVGVFLVVAMQTGAAGRIGEIISALLKGTFGLIAYVLPYYLILYGILLFAKRTAHIGGRSAVFLIVIFLMVVLMNAGRYIDPDNLKLSFDLAKKVYLAGSSNGGLFGIFVGGGLVKAIGKSGLYIFSVVMTVVSLLLVINTPISQFLDDARAKKAQRQRERAEAREMSGEEEYDDVIQEEADKAASASSHDSTKAAAAATASVAKKSFSIDAKKPPIDRQPIISYGNDTENESNDTAENTESIHPSEESTAQEKVYKTSYVPGKMSEGQINIMNYMKDDSLFENSGENARFGFGLEEADLPSEGYGLDGNAVKDETDKEDEITKPYSEDKINEADIDIKQPVKKLTNSEAAASALTSGELNISTLQKPYKLPPLELLSDKQQGKDRFAQGNNLKAKAAKLEETLMNFHVDAHVVQVTQGPAVTRYEIQPNVGVKVNSIVRLADDIALNMEAKSIRIEAPIPGKAAVGIEIENDRIEMVTIKEVIGSREFKNNKSKISFAVGRDIAGNAIVGDLKGMPHMLIAGSTGSGKSVCINSIIMSILYKAKPDEVKLILVDPKVVELGNYNGIPHLLIPVVTEPAKAAAALNWAVAEMNDRYKKFAAEGARDLATYNEIVKSKKEEDLVLPQVVIIIDELADLMMAAPSQVEESICRLAQLARAAGMHLIVATQRPSVDVITGVIKANIPSRIAFAVSSQFDSRTILDMGGAEKLVGKGDMLYKPQGINTPLRVQGNFVSDSEVHKVIEFVKAQACDTNYSSDVIQTIERASSPEASDDTDELLPEAIETVVKTGQASVSMLQRRFRIGYNRAARIIDMMEARGIIGPADGSRPRQVLLSEVDYYAMQDELREQEQKN